MIILITNDHCNNHDHNVNDNDNDTDVGDRDFNPKNCALI